MRYKKIKNLSSKVEECLSNYPETRNSDITLMIRIVKNYYSEFIYSQEGKTFVKLEDLYELPREDNIKRIRASFNSKGKYLPTDENVLRQRRISEDQWRLSMGYPMNCPRI